MPCCIKQKSAGRIHLSALLLYMNFLVEILFLDASSLVDLVLGIIDFLELLLGGTANILA